MFVSDLWNPSESYTYLSAPPQNSGKYWHWLPLAYHSKLKVWLHWNKKDSKRQIHTFNVRNHDSYETGNTGKTYGANFQTSATKTPGSCIMTTLRLTRRSLCSSFWFLRIRQSSPTIPTHRPSHPRDFFLFPNMKLDLKCRRFDGNKEIHTVSRNMMKTLTRNDFQKFLRSWKSRWNRCINEKGGCLEGDGANKYFVKWLSYSRGITGTSA
jgi:hypothetical protein